MQIKFASVLVLLAAHSFTARADPIGVPATYTTTNPTSGAQLGSGTAKLDGTRQRPKPVMGKGLQCWDAYRSGSIFAITCGGSRWYEFVDCSNGYRYTIGPFAGVLRGTLTCPGGSLALQGGAYGN
ncbi:hypothetical protein BGX34_001400 [Mortierella sp. NVP85]|nr:hypothetical protein BGX34_001400 [Mortierella sp. NVP85]